MVSGCVDFLFYEEVIDYRIKVGFLKCKVQLMVFFVWVLGWCQKGLFDMSDKLVGFVYYQLWCMRK